MPNMITQQEREENLAKVREAMRLHQQVHMGGELKNAVTIDYTSEEGNRYRGVVVFKKPTMGDYMRMGAIMAEILKNAGVTDLSLVDNTIKFMARVMATLSVVAVKRPEWLLKIEEVTEPDVIYHVYAKYEEWEQSFRKPVSADASDDSETSEGKESLDS